MSVKSRLEIKSKLLNGNVEAVFPGQVLGVESTKASQYVLGDPQSDVRDYSPTGPDGADVHLRIALVEVQKVKAMRKDLVQKMPNGS